MGSRNNNIYEMKENSCQPRMTMTRVRCLVSVHMCVVGHCWLSSLTHRCKQWDWQTCQELQFRWNNSLSRNYMARSPAALSSLSQMPNTLIYVLTTGLALCISDWIYIVMEAICLSYLSSNICHNLDKLKL